MRLCLSMWSLQEEVEAGRMDLSGFLDFCAAHGVETVELLEFLQKETPAQTRAMLKDRGIAAGAWSAANNFVQADRAAFLQQVDYLRRCIGQAAELGAPVLRVFSGDEHPAVRYGDGLNSILEGFRACVPEALAAGVTMALENHGVFAGRSGQVNAIVAAVDSPCLRATLDTANFLFVDEDPLRAVQNAVHNAGWVHFKDYRPCAPADAGSWPSVEGRYYAGTALGEGCVPLGEIAGALKDAGYGGCLSIEFEGPDSVAGTVRSIEEVKRILNGL